MFKDDTARILEYLDKSDIKYDNKNYNIEFIKKLLTDNSNKSEILVEKVLPDKMRKPFEQLHNLLYKNDFASPDIVESVHLNDIKCEQWQNRDIYIYIYTNSEKKPNIKLIILIINLIRQFSDNHKILLSIYYSDKTKKLPSVKKQKITAKNINSGCCLKNNFIYLWRKEEFYKVLLHELIHYYNLDFVDYDDELEKYVQKLFNIKGRNVINEAFTEILALTLYSIIISISQDIDFDMIIKYENLFTHLQIAKLIMYFGGESYDDLFNIIIDQTTSVVSYIIIKGILLNNYNDVLSYLEMIFFTNKSKRYKFNGYKKLFIKLMNKESLNRDIINIFIKNKSNMDEFIASTLRMTVFA